MIRLVKALLFLVPAGCAMFAQTPQTPAVTNAPDTTADRAGAYYNFAMGRLYTELAAAEGNKNDYVSKAIQHYQEALKLDPSAGIIFEELTDLYIQTGRLRDAVTQAEDLLKQNPDNLDARRMLGRIYVRALGTADQTGRVDDGTLRKAIEQYQKITEKDPKDAESWVLLGKLYSFSHNSPEAEKAFNAALEADPNNDDALAQLATLYADLGDTKRAIEKLKAAADKNPSERTLALLAQQYEELHDYKSAAEVLKKAIEVAPDNPRIVRGLAQDLMFSDQLDDALQIFQKLAADEPRDAQVQLSMSEIYRAKHDFAKSREALEKAKSLQSDSMEVRYQEVKLLEAEGKNDEALVAIKAMLDSTAKRTYSEGESRRRAGLLEEYGVLSRSAEKYPQAVEAFRQMANLGTEAAQQAAVQIIDTYRQAKDYDSALRECDAALKKYPDERRIKVEHATVLSDQGKTDAAAAELRALLGGDRDRETQLALAQIYEKAKRYSDMVAPLAEAEKLAKDDDDKVTVYFMRGAMYERMKKFDLSEAEFRKVLDLDSDNAGALNYLGYMLADRNIRLDEAYTMVKKALDTDPDNGAYLDSLGWVYFRQGKLEEAAGLLQRALDKMSTDPTVHDHLGDVYLKMGKTKDAIAQWQISVKQYQTSASSDADPEDLAKVTHKLDDARVRLARETRGK